ncbi:MAG: hypothetical protein U0412_06260 [Nitrospira sp.]
MKRWVAAMAVAVMMAAGVSAWAADEDGSQIKIVSPENGAAVKGDALELKYELAKGQHATHAHVYLDGQYQKGFSGTFKNLAPGKHEIKVVAANHDHKALAAEASVTIEVQ